VAVYLYYSHVQNTQNFTEQLMYLDIINPKALTSAKHSYEY